MQVRIKEYWYLNLDLKNGATSKVDSTLIMLALTLLLIWLVQLICNIVIVL